VLLEEVVCLLCSLARTIRNDSLTLVKSSENRNTRRFHHVGHYLWCWSSYALKVSGYWVCMNGYSSSIIRLCYWFLAPLLAGASGAYSMGDWCLDVCHQTFFKSLLLVQFLSDSYESWHTWSMCQYEKKNRFSKFCFTDFWLILKTLRQQRSCLGQLASSVDY